VNPGRYEAVLMDSVSGKEEVKKELISLNREAYVVVRVGVEASDGESFPEDIIVFPHSDASLLSFAAGSKRVGVGALALSSLLALSSVFKFML